MTTSEHMTQLAREHPGGFMVIPAMFERWAAEMETANNDRATMLEAINVLNGRITAKDDALRKLAKDIDWNNQYWARQLAQAALDAKEVGDASTPQS